jgi:hypothetical protein
VRGGGEAPGVNESSPRAAPNPTPSRARAIFKAPPGFRYFFLIMPLLTDNKQQTKQVAPIATAADHRSTALAPPHPPPRAGSRSRAMSGDGDACYFPRNLGVGAYGGDVHCLQSFLARRGYLLEEPTGYFGERTANATKRWQVRVSRREFPAVRGARSKRPSSSSRARRRAPPRARGREPRGCQISLVFHRTQRAGRPRMDPRRETESSSARRRLSLAI